MNDNLYSILGVAHTATSDELKERYRFLCHAYHPDKFATDSQRQHAATDFKRVNEAYQILSDPELRGRYDAMSHSEPRSERQPPPLTPANKAAAILLALWKETKEIVRSFMWVVCALATVGFLIWAASDWNPPPPPPPPPPPALPRPADDGFIDWLTGKVITTKKRWLIDEWWKVQKGEVSDFQVLKIAENPADKIYTATVSFRATAKGRGIQVTEAMIRYKPATEPGTLQFVEFVPVTFSRIGN